MTSPAVEWLGVEKLQGHFSKREDTPTEPGRDTGETLHEMGHRANPLAGSSGVHQLPATPDIAGMSFTMEIRLKAAQRAASPLPAAGHALAGCAFREHKSCLSEPSLARGTLPSSPTARANCPERSLPAALAALPWVSLMGKWVQCCVSEMDLESAQSWGDIPVLLRGQGTPAART